MHLIHSRVILYSPTVEVFAGKEEKQTFIVHKDLLTLHSTYFSNLFSDDGPGVDKKISISAEPSLFANFIAWIYFGEFLKVNNDALAGGQAVDDLWELGRFFKAPAFQNFCMDDCQSYCKASDTDPTMPWPFV
jgi:BTB/POZ domain